jgi:hypothetical protein
MLRHRVIQQCARLALGISAHENYIKNSNINRISPLNSTDKYKEKSSKSKALKELLAKEV